MQYNNNNNDNNNKTNTGTRDDDSSSKNRVFEFLFPVFRLLLKLDELIKKYILRNNQIIIQIDT